MSTLAVDERRFYKRRFEHERAHGSYFRIWIICGGAIGVRADPDTPTRDTVAEEAVLAAAAAAAAPVSDSTRIEASVQLAGRWRVAEATDEEKQRLKAIDEVTDRLGRFKRGKARSRLAERTVPPSSLMIDVTDSKVTDCFRRPSTRT